MIVEAALVCLALNVYHEARGEPFDGQVAVASVTLNRARSRTGEFRKLNTICDVVNQRSRNKSRPASCAFSWTCDKASNVARGKAWRLSLSIAHDAITGALSDNTGGALWYHSTRVRPIWRTRLAGARTIGSHIFYNIRRTGTKF